MELVQVKSVGDMVIARKDNILYVFKSLEDLKHYRYSDLYKIKTRQPIMVVEQHSDLDLANNLQKEVEAIEQRLEERV